MNGARHAMKILIACGGSGGHLFPGLAVAEALQARGDQILLVISEKEIDRVATDYWKTSTPQTTTRVETLPGAGLPKVFSPGIFRFGVQFLASLRRANVLLNQFQPDLALGMGGFACASAILMAHRRGIPAFLHESNTVPGKTNRWLAGNVDEVFVGFDVCADQFSPRATVTGIPIRAGLRRLPKTEARQKLALDPECFTLLILGGSQGAQALNQFVRDLLLHLGDQKNAIQFVHVTGATDFEDVKQAYRTAGVSAFVQSFLHQMQWAYGAADLVISRAGAATLAELAWFELPSLLIPYPHAAEQHQHRNADIFERLGAARILSQETLSGQSLARSILEFRANPRRLDAMARSSASFKRVDATITIMERMDAYYRRKTATTAAAHLSIALS